MRSWWHAYTICGVTLAIGVLIHAFASDQFAQIDRQKEALVASGKPVSATITTVRQGLASYEYMLGDMKHYGSFPTTAEDDRLSVGSPVQVVVSTVDPDISDYRPASGKHRSARNAGYPIALAAILAFLATGAADLRRRRLDGKDP